MEARIVPGWFARWFDNGAAAEPIDPANADKVDWLRCLPFAGMHLACLGVIWVGWSAAAVAAAALLYAARMFVITAFYHRYFSHRTFKTSRWFQGGMAFLGCTAVQRDPLWWASHHAHHHIHADEPEDPHSPSLKGFWKSHVGWFMTREGFLTRSQYVRHWAKHPELRFLNRFDLIPAVAFAAFVFFVGSALEVWAPSWGTNGPQMLVWRFFISTVALYHGTFTVNSLAHRFGSRRFATADDSRNNFWIALVTLGEGWHNNHHHYPGSVRQGFYWWEVDPTYYGLRLLERLGLVWDLRETPEAVLGRNRVVREEWGS